MLSPFEFFIFHYVSVVTRGPEWNQSAGLVENDSLYPVIFEDYLASLLAMGGAAFKSHEHTLVRPPLQSSPTSSRPSLLKADLFSHHASAPRPATFAPGLGPGGGVSSAREESPGRAARPGGGPPDEFRDTPPCAARSTRGVRHAARPASRSSRGARGPVWTRAAPRGTGSPGAHAVVLARRARARGAGPRSRVVASVKPADISPDAPAGPGGS